MSKNSRMKPSQTADKVAVVLGQFISGADFEVLREQYDDVIIPRLHFEFHSKSRFSRGEHIDRQVILQILRRQVQALFEYVIEPQLLLDKPDDFVDSSNLRFTVKSVSSTTTEKSAKRASIAPATICRVSVIRLKSKIKLKIDDEVVSDIDPDEATFLEMLIESRGAAVSGPEMEKKFINTNARASRVKARVTSRAQLLQDWIKGAGGKGYRLLPEAWCS